MLIWMKKHAWPVVERTWKGWQEVDGLLLSAAMAYYAAFSLFPLCLVLISILGFVIRFSSHAQDEQQQLLALVAENAGPAGPWLAQQLGALLAGVQSQATLGGPIGVLTLLVAALGVFVQLDYSFDRIFGTTRPSSSWLAAVWSVLHDRLIAFVMLLAVGGLLVTVFLANMILSGIRSYVVELPAGPSAWHWGQVSFTLVMNALLFGVIYKMLPRATVRWKAALAGGIFVSITWFVGQQILTSFVIGSGYTAYGVVGTFIAVMLWMYYASAVIFLGAEFVQALGRR
jgi:membrane protein